MTNGLNLKTSLAQFLKSTLNLPNTKFPMHRPKGLDHEKGLIPYLSTCPPIEECNSILLDGPPFANGNLHIGHALNKILKDIIVRSRKDMYWTPGWDCHGLPIELKARSTSGNGSDNSNPLFVRKLCKEFANEAIGNQKYSMLSWGLSCDYSQYYKTMNQEYEANQLRIFAQLVRNGLVYSALQPVYWSPSSKTALAEAEIEYEELECQSAYVKFPFNEKTSLLAWTTAPWTLFGNRALAYNPKIQYCRVDLQDESLIMSRKSAENLFPGNKMAEIGELPKEYNCIHSSIDVKRPILLADWVNEESGTGIVHLAPAHGIEDFLTCKEFGIEIDKVLIDENANYSFGPLNGLNVMESNDRVINYFAPFIASTANVRHPYPHDWRTKKPIVFRATKQWFIKTSGMNVDEIISQIKFHPESSRETIVKTIKSRKNDWCISRQRVWGVPIITKPGNDEILDPDYIEEIATRVEKEGSEFLLKEREDLKNTMDVWFDSGIAWRTINDPSKQVVVVEGSDQFRGWFQSLLLTHLAYNNNCKEIIKPPYNTLIKHGFVLDGSGKKMSKSLGNVVDPEEVTKIYGVDALRLWVASSDFINDVNLSDKSLEQCAEKLQKFRNTFKFILGNVHDLDDEDISSIPLRPVDQAIIRKAHLISKSAEKSYQDLNFLSVVRQAFEFVTEDLSGFYFHLIKDRLYITKPKSAERKSAQIALNEIGFVLLDLLKPIAPFLCAEADESLRNERYQLNLSSEKLPSIEELREMRNYMTIDNINRYHFFIPRNTLHGLKESDWKELLECARVSFSEGAEVKFELTRDHKCPRCWSLRSRDPLFLCDLCEHISIPRFSLLNNN